jgi:WhiB family transcriptional regulator, redox-sensing transcriptional regulator
MGPRQARGGPHSHGGMTMRGTRLPAGAAGQQGMDWWQSAACRTADPDMFFPVSLSGSGQEEAARAKEVCASCPVRRQCLQFALATRQAHGVWGGTTEEERRLRPPATPGAPGRRPDPLTGPAVR